MTDPCTKFVVPPAVPVIGVVPGACSGWMVLSWPCDPATPSVSVVLGDVTKRPDHIAMFEYEFASEFRKKKLAAKV
ncbi:hypothetical protein BE11_25295 [Sorangium cellulosum]|nr:hypothetical protein BE11_25295 [Sorangium cellulosum]